MLPLLTPLALSALSFPAVPQEPPVLNAYYETDRGGLRLTAEVHHGVGPVFALLARADQNGGPPAVMDFAALDANGHGEIHAVFPTAVIEHLQRQGVQVQLSAAMWDGTSIFETEGDFQVGMSITSTVLDFDYTIGDDSVMVAGRRIADQYQDVGLDISVRNTSGPDVAILFDSANPTGGDDDLRTPNPGAYNNTVPLGHLLIIAENVADANADDLIDVPDDDADGGSIYFDFAQKAKIEGVTLVDIDEVRGTQLRFYRNGDLMTPDEVLDLDSLGDGSVQELTFFEDEVDRFEVFFRGSGGVSNLILDTCPKQLNFDELQFGEPRGLPAGTWITDNFLDCGVTVAALNNEPRHPDKAILFDTQNITGGDTDLRTPNPGAPGNDEPLGMVLIIAENDVDANMDNLVDDPDDEAAGGRIEINWAYDVTFVRTRILDVDGSEIDYLRLYDAMDNEIYAELIPDAPDGAVQRIAPMVPHVRRAVLELGGSGALSRIIYCPDPATN